MKRVIFLGLSIVLTLTGLPSPASAQLATNWIIPAAGNTAGSGGTYWKTDLSIHNPQSWELPLVVQVLESDQVNDFVPTLDLVIYPYETINLWDVLGPDLFDVHGTGAILIYVPPNESCPDLECQFLVTSRTYTSDPSGGAGEFGQALPGAALTIGVSLLMPEGAAGSDHLAVAAGTGALAVSAMILPGISGSYVMLVLGQYQNVLDKLTRIQIGLAAGRFEGAAFLWLASLGAGIVIGLLLFARLLNFLLRRFRSATMAFLIGLLLGSLWVLWPFKTIEAGTEVTGRSGEVKEEIRIATAPNRLPASGGEAAAAAGALAAGLVGSAGMIAMGRRKGDGGEG